MLSHHERQTLARIEEWFHHDDPELAEALGHGRLRRRVLLRRAVRIVLGVLAVALTMLGAVLLTFGLFAFGVVLLGAVVSAEVRARRRRQRRPTR